MSHRVRARGGRRRRLVLVLVPVLVVAAVVALVLVHERRSASAAEQSAQAYATPFAADSPFRTVIPADASVDPQSATMIAAAAGSAHLYASMIEFGIPIYRAEPDTPRYRVACTSKDWGPCPFDGHEVPIPDGAHPHAGSDGAMVVVDADAGLSYEFWKAVHSGDSWQVAFGAVNDLHASGWEGAATGSGASRLGGIVRVSEIAAGVIPHALTLQTNNVCAGTFRAPAIKTDGRSDRPDCLPEGARLRLDPSIDLDALNLAPGVEAVARAMQVYGGYVVDIGGTSLSVSFELAPDSTGSDIGSVYRDAGFRWDYDRMEGVPWDRLQVLA